MDDYKVVLNARRENRLTASDYIQNLVEDFMEFHGDRYYGDDRALIGGIGRLGAFPVTVIGIEKGKNTEDRILHNFGSAHPEGYRKALRLMKQAEKFHIHEKTLTFWRDFPINYAGKAGRCLQALTKGRFLDIIA